MRNFFVVSPHLPPFPNVSPFKGPGDLTLGTTYILKKPYILSGGKR